MNRIQKPLTLPPTMMGIQLPSKCRLMELPTAGCSVPRSTENTDNAFRTGSTFSVSLTPLASKCVFWAPALSLCSGTSMN
jgi:hypothetical protein